jgi:hypothetical protein
MHNGMVWDNHLKRQHGEPEVDTYAIAVAAASQSGRNTPGPQHALDLIHAIAELEGSMAVIVIEEGAPFMATMRIDGSPLYTLNTKGVHISASTSAAVRAVADALHLPVPMEAYTYEIKKKGKTKKKQGTRPAIGLEPEGYVNAWCAGTHTEAVATLPARYTAITRSYGTGNWTDAEKYGIGHDSGRGSYTTSGNWDPVPGYDDDGNYEAIARKLLNAGDEYERCVLCDEMTDDCETWHTVTACAECRLWYAADGPVRAVVSDLDYADGVGAATREDLEWGK